MASNSRDPGDSMWSRRLAWLVLAGMLVIGLPLLLGMPACVDLAYFGVYVRNLQRGGVLYRDLFFLQPPGFVWVQLGVRSLLGWRLELVRLVDLLIVGGTMLLLASQLRRLGTPSAVRWWFVVAGIAFYLATSEWCHCQPDVWMLLPAMGALALRQRQQEALGNPGTPRGKLTAAALLEGLAWGMVLLIKPQAIVPVGACWLVTTALARRDGCGLARLAADGLGLLAGGLLTGAACAAWLLATGAWAPLLATVRAWAEEYYVAHVVTAEQRAAAVFLGFAPWGLLHLAAIPLAAVLVLRALARGQAFPDGGTARQAALLATCYLAWLAQAACWQWALPYHLVGPAWLGLAVLAYGAGLAPHPRRSLLPLLPAAALLVAAHPFARWERLRLWPRCLVEGSTPELRDRLTQMAPANAVAWVDLQRVADYLRGERVGDGELTCYHNTTIPLYLELDVQPSTRFIWIDQMIHFFPSHAEEIRRELSASRQRFIVSDLGRIPPPAASSPGSVDFPWNFGKDEGLPYPWSEPIVFRAGRYAVHRVDGPVRPLSGLAWR